MGYEATKIYMHIWVEYKWTLYCHISGCSRNGEGAVSCSCCHATLTCRLPHSLIMQAVATQLMTVALQLISCQLPHSLIMQAVATQLMTVTLQLISCRLPHCLIMQAGATQLMTVALQLFPAGCHTASSCRLLPHNL